MNRVLADVIFLVVIGAFSRASLAGEATHKLEWESVKDLANSEEIDKVQAELDSCSCSGVPTKRTELPASIDFGSLTRLQGRICNEAKFSRVRSDPGSRLLILQFGSMGSCGDFNDVLFVENDAGDRVTPVKVRQQETICGGGIYFAKRSTDSDVLVIPGGIDEIKDGDRVRGDLRIRWNGKDLKDISDTPQKWGP